MSKGLARLRLAWMESIFIKTRKSLRERVTRTSFLRKIVMSSLFFRRLPKTAIARRRFSSGYISAYFLQPLLSFIFSFPTLDILNYHYYLCALLSYFAIKFSF